MPGSVPGTSSRISEHLVTPPRSLEELLVQDLSGPSELDSDHGDDGGTAKLPKSSKRPLGFARPDLLNQVSREFALILSEMCKFYLAVTLIVLKLLMTLTMLQGGATRQTTTRFRSSVSMSS